MDKGGVNKWRRKKVKRKMKRGWRKNAEDKWARERLNSMHGQRREGERDGGVNTPLCCHFSSQRRRKKCKIWSQAWDSNSEFLCVCVRLMLRITLAFSCRCALNKGSSDDLSVESYFTQLFASDGQHRHSTGALLQTHTHTHAHILIPMGMPYISQRQPPWE